MILEGLEQEIEELETLNRVEDRFRIKCLRNFYQQCLACKTIKDIYNLPRIGPGILKRLEKYTLKPNIPHRIPFLSWSKQKELENKGIMIEKLIQNPELYRNMLTKNQYICLQYHTDLQQKIPRKDIVALERFLNQKKLQFIICGSFRRGQEFSKDIDILCHDQNHFQGVIGELNSFLVHSLTDPESPKKYMALIRWKNHVRRIDVLFSPSASFIPSLIYFTGSYEENIRLRCKAKQMGMKLNEYGLYHPTGKTISFKTEKDLYAYLDEPFKEPFQR